MNYKNYLWLVLMLISLTVNSQTNQEQATTWNKFVHVEIHGVLPNSKIKENLPIRQNVSNNTYGYDNEAKIIATTNGLVFGSKIEIYNQQLKVSLSTGIKYFNFHSTIKGKMSDNADYFYFRYVSDVQESRFARVRSIKENQQFLSIPLEFRYYFFNRKIYSFYTTLGTDLGINVYHKLNVVFAKPEMISAKAEVLQTIDQTYDKFYSATNLSIGFRYNYLNKVGFNAELNLYSSLLGQSNFILSEASRIASVKASIRIPLTLIKQ
ncbi:MAG: hypothetical protein N2449_07920 [Bacteroidales bacterium]|nr:hypothetical protein [Bacteroidales bacterium]